MGKQIKEEPRMDIEDSVSPILTVTNPYKDFSYEIVLNTKINTLTLTQIVSLERFRDYANNIGDYVLLTVKINLGDYIKLIYPMRDNLIVNINKTYANPKAKPVNEEYKAIIVNDQGLSESVGALQNMSRNQLNKDGFIEIEFQLYSIEIEGFRSVLLGGIYKNTTMLTC